MRNSNIDRHLHYSIDVPRGQQKFRELILYISKKCEDTPSFGATKLNKILFYSDFEAFRILGQPITGAPYRRLKKGPAPKALMPIRRDLEREGALQVVRTKEKDSDVMELVVGPVGPSFDEHRPIALRQPYLDVFTESELAIVDYVIKEFWDETNTSISTLSHKDVKWLTRFDMDDIPYEAAYLDDIDYTKEDTKRTLELAEEHGWDER